MRILDEIAYPWVHSESKWHAIERYGENRCGWICQSTLFREIRPRLSDIGAEGLQGQGLINYLDKSEGYKDTDVKQSYEAAVRESH